MSVTRWFSCIVAGTATTIALARSPGIALTPVGNPGQGVVSTVFQIGVYEITNEQYCAFLNAVAREDLHQLFHPLMAESDVGGILRSGGPGAYTYAVKPSFSNKPVFYVRWANAVRFVNWLENDRPAGPQNAQTTEDGAYTLAADELTSYFVDIPRHADARWFLPTLLEWKKAAYWDPAKGGTGGFWEYATRSDTLPMASPATPAGVLSRRGGNVVNFLSMANWNGSSNGNVTAIGSGAASAYGTYEQNGNVYEWTETRVCATPDVCGKQRAGGAYYSTANNLLHCFTQGADFPDRHAGKDGMDGQDYAAAGFRVAARCTADIDRNGVVDSGDYANFLMLLTTGNAEADLTGDEVVDFLDLLRFIAAYDSGC